MEDQLIPLFDFCREPLLALKSGTVFHLNPAARALFPNLAPGMSAAGTLPDYLMFDRAEQAVTSAVIGTQAFTARFMDFGALRLLTLYAERPTDRRLFSDGLINILSGALFNVGLSSRSIEKHCGAVEPELRPYLALLQHNYHQLVHQLSNLRLAIQLQEKAVLLRPRRCDLVAFCRELTVFIESLSEGKAAPLEFSSAQTELNACVDPELVERMLLNLLSNSFRHCTAGSAVRLRLDKMGDHCILSVDDNGSGIPDSVLQNVFTRYEARVCPAALTEPPSGGLGLGIARGIAELHGGALIIESKAGRGTSVRVMLPLEQPDADVLEDAQAERPSISLDVLLNELADVLDSKCYECELED